jgi:hypothetical protein
MESVRISKDCPSCGASEYRKVRARRWIAFTDDRICKSCGTRYSPPTPRWASVVFLVIGAILFLTGTAVVALQVLSFLRGGHSPGGIEIILGVGLMALGAAAAVHGMLALFFTGSV